MSLKKSLLAVAAVGALSAVTAVPASALENEFHGMYKAKYFVSNIDNSGAGAFIEKGGAATTTASSPSAVNYFEQRARLFYNAKANEDLKLVVGFEIDAVFGDRSQGTLAGSSQVGVGTTGNTTTAFRNSGFALDTDAVNLETKWVYLDFNIPGTPTNVKVGAQPIKDALKGILFDCDAAGIYTSTKIGTAAKVNLGYFRGYEGDAGATGGLKMGVNNLDLVILEGKLNMTKDLAFGANYYGYFDYRDANATILDHTLGLTADATMGPLAVSGFVAGQLGTIRNTSGAVAGSVNNSLQSVDLSAYAANVAARLKAGPGTAKLAGLLTSGDRGHNPTKNHSWLSLQQSVNGVRTQSSAGSLNSYNESGMMLLNRNFAAQGGTTDRNLIATANNRDQGMILLTAGYDANLTPKLYANANVGAAFVAKTRRLNLNDLGQSLADLKPATGSGNHLGTEINLETGYKVYDNLTASLQGAYVFLGNYYKGSNQVPGHAGTDPDDLYTARVVLSYVF